MLVRIEFDMRGITRLKVRFESDVQGMVRQFLQIPKFSFANCRRLARSIIGIPKKYSQYKTPDNGLQPCRAQILITDFW